MPATSQAMQQMFGVVEAALNGMISPDKLHAHARKIYNQVKSGKMKRSSVRHYAETKRKGLPKHK